VLSRVIIVAIDVEWCTFCMLSVHGNIYTSSQIGHTEDIQTILAPAITTNKLNRSICLKIRPEISLPGVILSGHWLATTPSAHPLYVVPGGANC
jgi:hypothetical protein